MAYTGILRANARLISQSWFVIGRPSRRRIEAHRDSFTGVPVAVEGQISGEVNAIRRSVRLPDSRVAKRSATHGSRQPSRVLALRGQARESEDAMKSLATKVQRFLVSEDGPTAVEYAVMLALIVIVCLTAIRSIGTNASATFQNVADQLQ
jgi:pilus assembly protein Flp/PilA